MAEITGGHVRAVWSEDAAGASLVVETPDGVDRFVLTPGDGRLRLGLLLPARRAPLDVSVQPGVVATALTPPGRVEPPGDVARTVSRWVSRYASTVGAGTGLDTDDPTAAIGAACFPVLRAVYQRGAGPFASLPRWAAGPLAATSGRTFAERAAGRRCSGRLVAALSASLAPAVQGDVARLLPLLLVVVGASVVDDDRLARAVESPPGDLVPALLADGELAAATRLLGRFGPEGAGRLLTDAASMAGGSRLFVDAVRLFETTGRVELGALRANLPELRDQLRLAHPLGQAPPVRARAAPAAQQATPARALEPPIPGVGLPAGTTLEPAAVLRACHGAELLGGRLRLVLPRTAGELQAWGASLGNCLASFDAAAHRDRSRLVGVEVDGRLRYCLEVDRDGAVRQFLAARNRPVPRGHAGAVLQHLLAAGVLRQPLAATWADLVRPR